MKISFILKVFEVYFGYLICNINQGILQKISILQIIDTIIIWLAKLLT